MRLKIYTLVLVPVILLQGYQVKKNTPRLPEPIGERVGKKGVGKTLSLLILGDSAAAGVGVNVQDDALLGSILAELSSEFSIQFYLHATTGFTTDQVIHAIQTLETRHFDVIITSVGVNDITKFTSPRAWIVKQKQIYQILKHKFSPQLTIASGVPPMDQFPALPNPLAWLFGQYAKAMNLKLSQFVAQEQQMDWIEYDLEKFKNLNLDMAEDGFHPSKEIYQLWGKQVAEKIRQHFERV
ncbi:SGNH/GDSL hydrolase family protein [Acinetobacter sp. TUM15064]|uniref:SGNH/GDSL hydrolase family protein n=1 Tax=Acinetobacter sp. TUM15064 TaxID=2609134 RepID=UPI00124D2D3A|nr:SGNH/GDSL hydrolase family protein [Acinetobacter sp. TUM15064]